MKLSYFQLEPHLAKSLSPLYLVSGDDILLKQDAVQLIRRAAKQAGFTEKIRISPENNQDWEQCYSLFHSPSLMGEKQLIELDCRHNMPAKSAAQLLEEYANAPSKDNVLIIDCPKIDDKTTKSGWFKSIDKNGIHLAVWPIPHEQLPKWIIQRAKRYKLEFHQDAIHLLADYVEGNLIAAAQVLEKIYLLKPEGIVNVNLINSILTDESRYNIFDFIDALTAGDAARSINILEHLKNEGIEPVLILWAITRELRLLSDLAEKTLQGSSLEALFQQQRIFAKRQSAIQRFLKKFKAKDCKQFLMQAASIDKIIKGALPGNTWQALQLFCLRMV